MTLRNKGYIRIICALSVLLCMMLGVIFAQSIAADPPDLPTIFYNDEVWYKEDILPLDKYYQSYYMPVSLLESLNGISVTENERFGTLLITYSSGSTSFISFNTKRNSAMTDEMEEFYVLTYEKDGERYVPVETVTSSLGIEMELYTDDASGKTALRICDGNQKKSFEELIKLYYVDSGTDTGGDDTTAPPVTPPTPLDAKTVYLTFDNIDKNMLDDVLDELSAHSVKATFFADLGDVNADVDYLAKLAAKGHSIGLAFDVGGYELDCAYSLNRQNDNLMRALKYKVRICRIYGENDPATVDIAKKSALDSEYIMCGFDIDLHAQDQKSVIANLAALDHAIKETDTLVIRFTGDGEAIGMLAQTLDFLEEKIICNAKTINDVTQIKNNGEGVRVG